MRYLGVLFLLASGCPEMADDGGDSPSGTEATAADAEMAASAVANAAMQMMSSGSSKASKPERQVAALAPAFSGVTATHTRSCQGVAVPTVSPTTPYQHMLDDSDASGIVGTAYLEMEVDAGERNMKALAIFDHFSFAPMTKAFTFDGTLGYVGTILSESEGYVSLTLDGSSSHFRLDYQDANGDPRNCDVVVNLKNQASMTYDEHGASYQRTLGGCVSLCGAAYAISGSESGSVVAP